MEGNWEATIGSLSSDVFEGRTSTGSEPFSLFICLDANNLVLLSFFSLMKRIYPRVSNKPLPNDAKGPLPVDVRRSTTLLLKLPNVSATASNYTLWNRIYAKNFDAKLKVLWPTEQQSEVTCHRDKENILERFSVTFTANNNHESVSRDQVFSWLVLYCSLLLPQNEWKSFTLVLSTTIVLVCF